MPLKMTRTTFPGSISWFVEGTGGVRLSPASLKVSFSPGDQALQPTP
jgi:hypothetical protein